MYTSVYLSPDYVGGKIDIEKRVVNKKIILLAHYSKASMDLIHIQELTMPPTSNRLRWLLLKLALEFISYI